MTRLEGRDLLLEWPVDLLRDLSLSRSKAWESDLLALDDGVPVREKCKAGETEEAREWRAARGTTGAAREVVEYSEEEGTELLLSLGGRVCALAWLDDGAIGDAGDGEGALGGGIGAYI